MQIAILRVVLVLVAERLDDGRDVRIFEGFLGQKAHVQEQFAEFLGRVAQVQLGLVLLGSDQSSKFAREFIIGLRQLGRPAIAGERFGAFAHGDAVHRALAQPAPYVGCRCGFVEGLR